MDLSVQKSLSLVSTLLMIPLHEHRFSRVKRQPSSLQHLSETHGAFRFAETGAHHSKILL